MSVKIIFPPFAEHALNGPFLAPHLLATILENDGFHSEAIDLNIRFIRKILNPSLIQNILSENFASSHDAKILEHFISLPLSDYIKYSTDGLVYVLKILRKIVITDPADFDSCISCKPHCNSVITNIYFDLVAELKLEETDIVGFSIPFAEQFPESLLIADTIKKIHTDVKIIVGGSQINLLNENQIKALQKTNIFNVIAKGDGESGIINLIRNIKDYDANTLIQFPPVNQKILDEIPNPKFNNTTQYFGKLILPILVTKGCYWGKCSFCDYIKLSDIQDKNYIARKPETVLNEIRQLETENQSDDKASKHVTFFLISDAIPPHWYKKLCELAIESKFKLKTWSYLIHSNLYDRNFFEILSDAGVKAITFGTESINDRLLDVLKKNFTKEIILRNLQDASDLKFAVTVNIIPDIPSTTYEESLNVFKEIQLSSSLFDILNVQSFVLTSDTIMSKYPEKFGIKIINSTGSKTNHGFHSLSYFDLNGISDVKRKNTLHAFYEFSIKMKIQKRIKLILQNQILDETVLYFDPTAFVIEEDNPELFLGSLKTGFPIEKWEVEFFNQLFLSQNLALLFSEIRLLYCRFSKQNSTVFLKYFLTILKKGVFVKSV